ncbi:unnamed protein product, partial [Mycena citricolor]
SQCVFQRARNYTRNTSCTFSTIAHHFKLSLLYAGFPRIIWKPQLSGHPTRSCCSARQEDASSADLQESRGRYRLSEHAHRVSGNSLCLLSQLPVLCECCCQVVYGCSGDDHQPQISM